MRFPNYYALLEVNNFSDPETVKKAYKDKVRQFHPDLHPNNPRAEEIMKLLNHIKDVLLNADSKAQYDNSLNRILNPVQYEFVFVYGYSSNYGSPSTTAYYGF